MKILVPKHGIMRLHAHWVRFTIMCVFMLCSECYSTYLSGVEIYCCVNSQPDMNHLER